MPTSSRKIVINKGYVGDDSATNESLGLKQISLKEANFGAASDPGSALYETHEEKPHPARRSNGRYLQLFFFACLLSIVAIILSLLSLWGNFGEKCDCSKTEALTTSVEKLSADVIKISSLEENMTRLQRDLIEKEAELNSTRLSLDYLQKEHNNLSEKTKAWLDTIRNDANSTRIQLMASDADAKVALDAVNTTKTLKLNILDAALSQLTTYLKRTNVDVNEVNSTLLETDAELSSVRNDLDNSKKLLMTSEKETRKTLAAVNSSFFNEVEKLDSYLNQLKSALNRTNTHATEIRETLRKYPCCSNPCKNGGTCYLANERCKFICACAPGFVGEKCEKTAENCKEINDDNKEKGFPVINQSFPLKFGSTKILVYCHTTSLGLCGDGGWTLVMKINGSKNTFNYDSEIWSNKTGLNIQAGMTGLDDQETKLPTYWKTNFTKICLGMKTGGQVNFMLMNKTAESLHSLIADGEYRNTSLGRDAWKSLLGSEGSLQLYCNKEGFNTISPRANQPKARIGILGNDQNNCESCDSRIGFGTAPGANTCGNVAAHRADNGNRNVAVMGYIFVQ